MNKYTQALLLGIGSLFLCFTSSAAPIKTTDHNSSAGCPFISIAISKQVNVSCNGGSNGSAIATASGGAAPYSYSWSPAGGTNDTAVGLSVGSYTVTATDKNGCKGTKKITITQPSLLRDSISSQINVKCSGSSTGTAKVGAKGGVLPYTYSWAPTGGSNPQANNLSAGTYTCTVTDKNGCSNTAIATITQPATSVSGNVTTVQPSCNGGNNGTATANPSGGASPYTYKWTSPSATTQTITGLAAGTYVCTIKDANGCMVVVSGIVKQPPAMVLSKSQTTATCNSSNATATVSVSSGVSPYTYVWSPTGQTTTTASGLSAGIYTLTVTDANACVASTTYLISNTGMTATTTVTNVTPCFGSNNGTATGHITGGTSPYTYLWSTGATTSAISSLAANSYTITISDKNGCKGLAKATITEPTQLRDSIISTTNVLCNGSSTGVAKVGVKGGGTPYTYSWAPSGGTATTASGLSAGSYTCTVTDKNGCSVTAIATINQPAAPLSATITSSGPSCSGNTNGTATAVVTGGTTPYKYSWSTGSTKATISNLSAGSYTCTVTDANGCTSVPSVTLVNPAVLTANITASTNATCGGGGSATVTAGGGTTPYTYSWAPIGGTNATATGLFGGAYTVTVTDNNGCTATANVTLTSSSSLAVTISASTDPTCNASTDGSATATAIGGTSPYSYSWTPSGGTNATASGLSVGTYTMTLTDNVGCIAIASVTLSTPAVTATISASANPLCNGGNTGSATVTAGGGNPGYTYNWSPSGGTNATASNLTAGGYTVTVTDSHSCTATANITLVDPSLLTASITASTNPLCNGDFNGSAVVVASGGTGLMYSYSWALSGGTTDTAAGLNAGTYTVTVTDSNSCTATANVTLTDPAALVASITSSNDPLCAGNSNGSATASVTGGTSPYTYSWTSGASTSTASALSAGSYTVTVTDVNGCSTTTSVTLIDPTPVTASISGSNDPLCNGGSTGSATVAAGGGTGTYTYLWTGGQTNATASGLSAGSYTVTVTDGNSCSATTNVTLTDPALLTASISGSTNILCNGSATGDATVTAGGGTLPYSYSWTSGSTTSTANGLTAGGYTVTVTDANGCSVTANVTLTEPSAITVTGTTVGNASCGKSNGSASITVTGGVGSYTYSWAPAGGTNSSAINLSAATYTVTVTDANSCSIMPVVIVKDSTTLAASFTSHVNELCNGNCTGKAFGAATGGTAPYTYSWSPISSTTDSATGLCAGLYNFTVTDNVGCVVSDTISISQPARITVTPVATSASCNGNCDGSITANVTGGTPGYNYLWSNGQTASIASGLCASSYTITITDANGCVGDTSAMVTQPVALKDSMVVTNVTCNGGTNGCAAPTISGGTAPYTYSWSSGTCTTCPSICGLSAGTYTVTVTDMNNCSIIDSAVITEPTAISITQSTTPASCGGNNGTATVVASGGTPGYTYNWSPSGGTGATANNLTAGVYTCTVTDTNGCSNTATAAVSNVGGPTVTSSQTNPLCNGGTGTATVVATGGTSPYTYNWTPSGGTNSTANGLTAGSYTCTVTDNNGCVTNSSVTITQPTALAVVIDSSMISTGYKLWAVVTGGVKPFTYNWTPGSATTDSINISSNGTYSVTVTDSNGCTQSATVTIVTVGIQAINNVSDVKIYPVPTTGILNIQINGQGLMPQTVMVYDITGRKVMEQKVDKTATLIHMDVSALSNGTYLLEINGVNNRIMARFTVGK